MKQFRTSVFDKGRRDRSDSVLGQVKTVRNQGSRVGRKAGGRNENPCLTEVLKVDHTTLPPSLPPVRFLSPSSTIDKDPKKEVRYLDLQV